MPKIIRAIIWTFALTILFSLLAYHLNPYLIKKYFGGSLLVEALSHRLFGIIYMWIPGIIALIFAKKEGIKITVFKKQSKGYLLAIFSPIFITILTIMMSLFFVHFNSGVLHQNFVAHPIANLFLNLLFYISATILSAFLVSIWVALGEEIMWRGYLWEKLKYLGFAKASLFIGVIWGMWHSPIIVLFGHNYPNHPYVGSICMIILCLLMTPILIYLAILGKSVILPAIFHGLFNAVAPYSILVFEGSNRFIVGCVGLTGFLALALVNLLIFMKMRPELIAKENSVV